MPDQTSFEAPDSGGPRRRALVTGASSGIGRAFAQRLARDQHNLILVARRQPELEKLAAELRAQQRIEVEVWAADLTKEKELHEIEARLRETSLDLLINNAGFGTAGNFWELDVEREHNEVKLNVVALMRLTHAVLPAMAARGRGELINVSSMAAFQPGPGMATYAATKAFVNSFSEALAEEFSGRGVRVMVLCPGMTRTEFQERAGVESSKIPDFTWMTAEEVVEAALEGLRSGDVICVPGFANRVATQLTSWLPRSANRKLAAGVIRRAME